MIYLKFIPHLLALVFLTSSVVLYSNNQSLVNNPVSKTRFERLWLTSLSFVCTAGGSTVKVDPNLKPLVIKATGRGSRQFCRMDKYGFPRTGAKPRTKNFFGFKTGDMVKTIIPVGARTKVPTGTYTGRVVVRSSGYFDVKTKDTKITVSHKHCKLIHLMDGYSYD